MSIAFSSQQVVLDMPSPAAEAAAEAQACSQGTP